MEAKSDAFFLGRQPIFNRRREVVAYELLYRQAGSSCAQITNADQATAQVILDTFSALGLKQVAGDADIYINLTEGFFYNRYPIPFPPEKTVIEVPETIRITDKLVKAISDLSSQGYRIALDDVTDLNNVKPLLPFADIVKLDLPQLDRFRLHEYVNALRRYPIQILAEKVERPEELVMCQRTGFDLFQGFFLCRPEVVSGRRLDASRIITLQLISKLQDPEISFSVLETLISQDVTLSYKLLQLINSVYYGVTHKVNSIRQAMSLLGLKSLRNWVIVVSLFGATDKPRELTRIALVRAQMCELLARQRGFTSQETYFLTGMLSVLDALLDQPITQAIKPLQLADEVETALNDYTGPLGITLANVIAYERGAWEHLDLPGVSAAEFTRSYWQAQGMVEKILGELPTPV